MDMMASYLIGLFYNFSNWYKMIQVDLLNSLDAIIVYRQYDLSSIQGRPSIIVWLATMMKAVVKAASLPATTSSLGLNMTAFMHGSTSSGSSSSVGAIGGREDELYYRYQLYTDGSICGSGGDGDGGNGRRRSTIVQLVCGTYNTIINVTESKVSIDRYIYSHLSVYLMMIAISHCLLQPYYPSLYRHFS